MVGPLVPEAVRFLNTGNSNHTCPTRQHPSPHFPTTLPHNPGIATIACPEILGPAPADWSRSSERFTERANCIVAFATFLPTSVQQEVTDRARIRSGGAPGGAWWGASYGAWWRAIGRGRAVPPLGPAEFGDHGRFELVSVDIERDMADAGAQCFSVPRLKPE